MTYILTSNQSELEFNYSDDFELSLFSNQKNHINLKQPEQYHFQIFSKDTKPLTESYQSENEFYFEFHDVPDIGESIRQIAETIVNREQKELEKDEDLREELTIIVCCTYKWNRRIVNLLNEQFREFNSELECLDLYRYMKIGSTERMTQGLKGVLNTDHIYPDDPVMYGFAIYQITGGVI